VTNGTATPDDRETEAEEQQGPIIRDRRRIDPQTGALRGPAPAGDASAGGEASAPGDERAPDADSPEGAVVAELQQEIEALRNDLKRVQAEYVNYKRRVDRDRQSVRELAVGSVLTDLLPVLDDIGRAREHGELEGGFKAVAEALETTLSKLGLERYGEPGDPFDPRIHEALMHQYSDDVDGPTCWQVLQPGYRHGERVLRPARVAVAEPTADLPKPADSAEEADSEQPGETESSSEQ